MMFAGLLCLFIGFILSVFGICGALGTGQKIALKESDKDIAMGMIITILLWGMGVTLLTVAGGLLT